MEHIGIDLHKQNSQICIFLSDGEILETRIRTKRSSFDELLASRPPAKILIESSTESEWVAQHLEGQGHEVIVADPGYAPMYATRSRRIKTDRRDARTLAEACKMGTYRKAHRTSEERRKTRTSLGVREALIQTRTRFISFVRAELRRDGFRIASGASHTFVRRFNALGVPPDMTARLAPLLEQLGTLNAQIALLDTELSQIAKQDEQMQRLTSMPSVGPVTAAALVSVIDDPSRFKNAKQLRAYLGLVPREMSSGEKQRRGRITKTGNSRARRLLVQVALSTMRLQYARTSPLWKWAEAIAQRKGRQIAAVALARRLAGILWAMMRDQTQFHNATPEAA